LSEGSSDGSRDGFNDGSNDGFSEGSRDGSKDGFNDGSSEGSLLGDEEELGAREGLGEGVPTGERLFVAKGPMKITACAPDSRCLTTVR